MPAPLDAAEVARRWAAIDRLGSIAEAARELGLTPHTLTEWSRRGRAEDPAIKNAMAAVNTQMVPQLVWAKTKSEDGISYSTLLKPAVDSAANLERIRAALENMKTPDPLTPPDVVHDDLCNVFHMPDVHLGMFARREITGDADYDMPLAISDLKASFDRVMRRTPMGHTAVLLFNGDFFQCDDKSRKTPQHKHDLDAVTDDYRDVQVMGVELCAYLVQRAASWHRKVIVRVERGNHDLNSHNVLRIGLKYRFQNDATIEVDMAKRDYFLMRWGRALVTSTHGDRGSVHDFVLRLSSLCDWPMPDTPHQYAFTGHRHRAKMERIGQVYWEQADPITPTDDYGSQWAGKRALVCHTIDRVRGRTGTSNDPLERL